MGNGLKKRGVLGTDRRVTIPTEWKDKFPDDSFYEMEIYGEKILITFFVYGDKRNAKAN